MVMIKDERKAKGSETNTMKMTPLGYQLRTGEIADNRCEPCNDDKGAAAIKVTSIEGRRVPEHRTNGDPRQYGECGCGSVGYTPITAAMVHHSPRLLVDRWSSCPSSATLSLWL
jgi:hypothetical protein